jgi:arylformamidase
MLYDITPPVSPDLPVWPGDVPMSREVLLDMKHGDNITLSAIKSTVHIGAHADAPSHYARDGATIDQRPLDLYLGPCQVIRVAVQRHHRITTDMIKVAITEPRVLFATGEVAESQKFKTDFAALSPELVEQLHHQGVRLIGIDTPSVDLYDSKDLPSHHMFLRHNMAILEGLVLADVPEGVYELIALPLRLVGFDASPVRAVLRT